MVWTDDPRDPLILAPPGPPASVIREARLTAAGEVLDGEARVLWNGGYGSSVALAAAPDRLLVFWGVDADPLSAQATLQSMVLAPDGTPLTGPQLVLIRPALFFPAYAPDVDAAWSGSTFVAAWTERTQTDTLIRYQHIDVNGLPIEAVPLELEPHGVTKFSPSLASTASDVRVAFEMIAGAPYGDVARVFLTTLDRLQRVRRPVTAR